MRKYILLLIASAFIFWVFNTGANYASADNSPRIKSVTNPILVGETMSIDGVNLNSANDFGKIFIDKKPVNRKLVDGSKDGTVLFFKLPNLTNGKHSLYVTTGSNSKLKKSNVVRFKVSKTVKPSISILSPMTGDALKIGQSQSFKWETRGIPSTTVGSITLTNNKTEKTFVLPPVKNTGFWTWPYVGYYEDFSSEFSPGSYTVKITMGNVTSTVGPVAISSQEEPSTVDEEVKCIFNGSTSTQECGARDPNTIIGGARFGCSGIESCIANVGGKKGTQLMWESSCDETSIPMTTIDGDNEYANFNCGNTTNPSIAVISPNGGETFTTGKSYPITWQTKNLPLSSKVMIQLRGWSHPLPTIDLTTVDASSQSYTWTVPSSLPTGDYRIEIYHIGPSGTPADGLTKAISQDSFIVSSPVNQTPLIGNTTSMGVRQNETVNLSLAKVVGPESQASGMNGGIPLSISSMSEISERGGTIQLTDTHINYTPPVGYVGKDSFTFVITDGQGRFATSKVLVTVSKISPQTVVSKTLLENGYWNIRFATVPMQAFNIYVSTDQESWVYAGTAVAGTNGILTFEDPEQTTVEHFYFLDSVDKPYFKNIP